MSTKTESSVRLGFSLLLWLAPLETRAAEETEKKNTASASAKTSAGPFAVETIEQVPLRDEQRKKELPVFVSFPKGDGPFPVIVFSHGAGGSGDMGFPIVRHWTSHGFVVLCPTHADSIKLRRAGGDTAGAGVRELLRDSIGTEENNAQRPRDLTFLLDSLDELEKKIPALQGKLDRDRIGAGGHSFGAYTAQVAGGATVKLGGKETSLADPRLKAVLQLSGQGKDQQGLHEHSWDAMKLPMMCVTGSRDRGAQGQEPLWRRDPFEHSPPGGKYFVFIEGANHGSFTGKQAETGAGNLAERFKNMTLEEREKTRERLKNRAAGNEGGARARPVVAGADQKEIFDWVKQATTAFWDAHLRGEAEAQAWLASEALVAASGNKLTLERK